MGENLSQARAYSDISLYFESEELIAGIERPEAMKLFSEKLLKISLELSEELRKLASEA